MALADYVPPPAPSAVPLLAGMLRDSSPPKLEQAEPVSAGHYAGVRLGSALANATADGINLVRGTRFDEGLLTVAAGLPLALRTFMPNFSPPFTPRRARP